MRLAYESMAIGISEPNDLKIIWHIEKWSAHRWMVNIVNETMFIMKDTGGVGSIDIYNPISGQLVQTFHHTLISTEVADLFGDFQVLNFGAKHTKMISFTIPVIFRE